MTFRDIQVVRGKKKKRKKAGPIGNYLDKLFITTRAGSRYIRVTNSEDVVSSKSVISI